MKANFLVSHLCYFVFFLTFFHLFFKVIQFKLNFLIVTRYICNYVAEVRETAEFAPILGTEILACLWMMLIVSTFFCFAIFYCTVYIVV